jgi:hypothetical protein
MQRKILLPVLLISSIVISTLAQTSVKLPEKKYNDMFNYNKLRDDLKGLFGYSIAYHTSTFTNPNYAINNQNGEIKNSGGFEIMFRHYTLLPILVEYGGFADFYKTTTLSDLNHFGAKLSVSAILFPCPKFFIPYGGVGYQLSYLKNSDFVINTSSPIWKVGFQSFLGQKFSINCEYSQSFLNPARSSNQFSIGVGFFAGK